MEGFRIAEEFLGGFGSHVVPGRRIALVAGARFRAEVAHGIWRKEPVLSARLFQGMVQFLCHVFPESAEPVVEMLVSFHESNNPKSVSGRENMV